MKEEIEKSFGKINVEIEGLQPYGLLMHNIENAELTKSTKSKTKEYPPEEEAEKNAYWMDNGGKKELCVPERCISGCILNGAKGFKAGKTSLVTLMAGAIRIEPERVSLGTDKYDIDIRAVRIGNAMIKRARPLLKNWKLSFVIVYNKDYLNPDSIELALNAGGIKAGLLDFRPARKGKYGTFRVTKFEVVN